MKKTFFLTALVLMLCLILNTGANAESIKAEGSGYENIPFSNGFYGFCIDINKKGVSNGDSFYEGNMSDAISNGYYTQGQEISTELKLLFILCFEDIFVLQDGVYTIQDPNTVQGAVYHFSNDQHVWDTRKELTNKVKAYTGPAIPDHGYVLTLSNGDQIEFDFMVLIPENTLQQNFFAFKFRKLEKHVCGDPKRVTGQQAQCDKDGWEDYYQCDCGKFYVDPECKEEIVELEAWKQGTGKTTAEHQYGDYVSTDPVKHWKECTCGDKTAEDEHAYDDDKDIDCNTCGFTRSVHEHVFSTTLSYDQQNHWYDATCGHDVKFGLEAHHGGKATCIQKATCDDCSQPYGNMAEHQYDDYVSTDPVKHWKECMCGDKTAEDEHAYDDDKDTDCNTCGFTRTVHEHVFSTTLSYDQQNHWYDATCGHDVKFGLEAHHGGKATCIQKATCDDCSQPYGNMAEHQYDDYVSTDPVKHWKECMCGDKTAEDEHAYDDDKDTDCNTCGFTRDIITMFYTLNFVGNGGTGTMMSKYATAGVALTVPGNEFVRPGYTFQNWNTSADGSGKAYSEGMVIVINRDITLFAQWRAESPISQLRIDKHPEDQYVTSGQCATFSVQASGDELRYQWFIDRNNGKGWNEIDSTESASYTIPETDTSCNGFRYYCSVSDKHNNSINSDVALLYVEQAPILPETGDSFTPDLWLMLSAVSLLGMMQLHRKLLFQ